MSASTDSHHDPPPKRSEPCGEDRQVSLSGFAESVNNTFPSRVLLPNCSAVVSDRCSFKLLAIPKSLSFYIHTVHHRLRVIPTHGKVLPEGLSPTLTRDIIALRFRQPFFRAALKRSCLMSLAQLGLRHRRLGEGSRCHLCVPMKRRPWDRCYSWW